MGIERDDSLFNVSIPLSTSSDESAEVVDGGMIPRMWCANESQSSFNSGISTIIKRIYWTPSNFEYVQKSSNFVKMLCIIIRNLNFIDRIECFLLLNSRQNIFWTKKWTEINQPPSCCSKLHFIRFFCTLYPFFLNKVWNQFCCSKNID